MVTVTVSFVKPSPVIGCVISVTPISLAKICSILSTDKSAVAANVC